MQAKLLLVLTISICGAVLLAQSGQQNNPADKQAETAPTPNPGRSNPPAAKKDATGTTPAITREKTRVEAAVEERARVFSGPVPSQSEPTQQISVQTAPAANADTRFSELRKDADQFRVVYQKLDGDNMAEIDALMHSQGCQINRVDGLLARVVTGLDQWNDAELKYWAAWGDAEEDRVAGQQKSLASMEADQKRAEDLVNSTQKDRESLLRAKANLEKFGTRTEAISKQIDSLIVDLKESEARLDEAQKNYEEASIRVRNMQASISARVIDIRQNKQRVEAYGLEMRS